MKYSYEFQDVINAVDKTHQPNLIVVRAKDNSSLTIVNKSLDIKGKMFC